MRDERGRSPSPKPLGEVLGNFRSDVAPVSPVAAVQAVWPTVAGERIASVTEVAAERDGTVTIECESAVWAQELSLMAPRIEAKLRAKLGDLAPTELLFRTGG